MSTKGYFTGAIEIVDLDRDDDDYNNNVTPAACTTVVVDDDDDDVHPVIRRISRLSTGARKIRVPTPSFSTTPNDHDTYNKETIMVDANDATTRVAPVHNTTSIVGGPSLYTARARTCGSSGHVGVA